MKIRIDNKVIWINYHHLYCFYIIHQNGSLQKASSLLGIGQSALSIQMKQFESQLGFKLFERSHRKLEANERGKIIFSYAKEIFRMGEEMIHTLHDRPASNRIHLQIGTLDTIPKHLSVELAKKAVLNKWSVSMIEGKQAELLTDLMEYRIDILVTNHIPTTEPGRIYTKAIARMPLWIIGNKDYLNLKKNFPKSLNQKPFVVPTAESRVRQEFESFCTKNHIQVDTLAETQDIMVQKLLAIEGIGLSIMPEFAVNQFLNDRSLYLIGKIPGGFEELYLITAARKITNPAATFFMKNFIVQ
jgi:LysR family transcriptional activator of nhaA